MKDTRSSSHYLPLEPADGLEWDCVRVRLRRSLLSRMTLYSVQSVRNWVGFLQSA